MKRSPLLILAIIGILSFFAQAQELEEQDKEDIQARARQMINDFESLLDMLDNPDIRRLTVFDRIRGSYGKGDGFRHIFYDSTVVVENDLHPNAYASTYENNVPIWKYLQDFHLTYEKSYRKTVFFTDIEVSDVEQGEYIYVLATYTSTFRGRNINYLDLPYKPQERRATLRADYDRYKDAWMVYITSIEYVHKPIVDIEPVTPDTAVAEEISIPEVEVAPLVETEIVDEENLTVEYQNLPGSIKRGKQLDIKWTESLEQKSRDLLLYLDGIKVQTLKSDLTGNQYQWLIPDKQSPGKYYQLGLVYSDSDEIYLSETFKIKRKIPLGAKVFVPAAITGAVIYIICCTGNGGPELPDPPTIY
jgi:hypothetical protein